MKKHSIVFEGGRCRDGAGNPTTLGRIVKLLREKSGMSQAELAEKAGMAQARVCQIENDFRRGNITLKTLIKISAGLGYKLDINIK